MATAMKTRISLRPVAPVVARAAATASGSSRPLWLPGSQPPKHLDGSLPGDYGFDPLNLGVEKKNLEWYKNAEVFHCRLAMTAIAGILIPSALLPGFPQWFNAGAEALKGSPFPYSTLFAIELFLFGFVEGKRWMDILKPGSQAEAGSFFGFEGAFKGSSAGPPYPGGPFNPVGFGKDGSGNVSRDMQVKEIKNGRLAMVALVGFVAQYAATGKGPLQNLTDHLANPWQNNFTTNGISLPIPELVK